MSNVKFSFDNKTGYHSKPTSSEVSKISNRVAENVSEMNPSNMRQYAEDIGSNGYTFCPATFKDGKRRKL